MLLVTLGAGSLENVLTGKGVIHDGKEKIKAVENA